MIRRPPRSTLSSSSAASDVYKRQSEQSCLAKYTQSPLATCSNALVYTLLQVVIGLPSVPSSNVTSEAIVSILAAVPQGVDPLEVLNGAISPSLKAQPGERP
eukprot:TRINITY_DN60922_c0_g1_i1.p2 TRINITY_DN60922_c0_g1~~TRINITY_DN60922_c0_g1_i1.p2  ORF type:complete len:102 (+),score=13.95 TRINITY_DN60922_c0_g1_i1:118-423(+)